MNEGLFPLRSLPWKSGITDGGAAAAEVGPTSTPDDWQEIRMMLRSYSA